MWLQLLTPNSSGAGVSGSFLSSQCFFFFVVVVVVLSEDNHPVYDL